MQSIVRRSSTQVTNRPKLSIHSDTSQPRAECVEVHNLDSDMFAAVDGSAQATHLLQSILRVRVVETGVPGCEDLPDVFGHYRLLAGRLRFISHFPFESGVSYRASFDPRPLGRSELSHVETLDFSFPREMSTVFAEVKQVFPTSDSLPENLLRFYVCFSNSMCRGHAEKNISVLGPDGECVPDVLYRPPVELWDRSMRHLTVLLDPGRLKRGVGPNRELGPPLKVGEQYTLAVGSGMLDMCGRPLRESFYKPFRVTEAVRERIAVEEWKIVLPKTKSRNCLALMFPKPLDWALLRRAIYIESEGGQPIDGRIAIDQDEGRWSFTPTSPWMAGAYCIRIASSLEDVCGNNLLEPFDRPFRAASGLVNNVAQRSMPFHLA